MKFKTFKIEVSCTCHRHVEGWQRDCSELEFISVPENDNRVPVSVRNSSRETVVSFEDGSSQDTDDFFCGFGETAAAAEDECRNILETESETRLEEHQNLTNLDKNDSEITVSGLIEKLLVLSPEVKSLPVKVWSAGKNLPAELVEVVEPSKWNSTEPNYVLITWNW